MNKKKYNGIEFDNDLDINTYEAQFRDLDPQIGTWWQIDPEIDKMYQWSTYASNYDNPIRYEDHLGNEPNCCGGFFSGLADGFVDGLKSTGQFIKSLGTVQGWKNVGNGLVDLADRSNPTSITGAIKNVGTAQAVVEGAKNIPNMSAKEIGHAIGFGAEKIAETVVLTKGTGAVTNAVKGAGSTNLFRAVSGVENIDAAANGVRNIGGSGYATTKLFATTASDAAQYGKNNFALDITNGREGIPNSIMKVRVPNSVMKTAYSGEMDGMKGVAIPGSQLSKVQYKGSLNYSPKPTNPYGMHGW